MGGRRLGAMVAAACLGGLGPWSCGWLSRPTGKTPAPGGGAFTGPEVPALARMWGDYAHTGARTRRGRTDTPKLLVALRAIGATDYMHLVWTERRYPGAWDDFKQMAPDFDAAKIRLWLYLTPPSEGASEPFGDDYVRWAVECAKVARRHPSVAGLCIDDFNWNVKALPPAYCKRMMGEAHKTAPRLALLVVGYWGAQRHIAAHVEAGAVDGVVFPYIRPHYDHARTDTLAPQIRAYRRWLDRQTAALGRRMPLVVMVYASKYSTAPTAPTPEYVKACIEIAAEATKDGLADGVVTYCLPKSSAPFVRTVTDAYARGKAAMRERPGNLPNSAAPSPN